MSHIEITLPDDDAERIIHALSVAGGKSEDGIENARQTVLDFITATVRNVEYSEALAARPEPQITEITLS